MNSQPAPPAQYARSAARDHLTAAATLLLNDETDGDAYITTIDAARQEIKDMAARTATATPDTIVTELETIKSDLKAINGTAGARALIDRAIGAAMMIHTLERFDNAEPLDEKQQKNNTPEPMQPRTDGERGRAAAQHLAQADAVLGAMSPDRNTSIARTHTQTALLWLMSGNDIAPPAKPPSR